MTTDSLAPASAAEISQYRLPESDRRKILAQADSAIVYAEIERQRQAFIRMYGNEWGVEEPQQA